MKLKSNLTSKGWSVVLAIALILPFGVNLMHQFSHDKHDHCTETGVTHFHEKAMDCDLCDFHITPVTTFLSGEFSPELFPNFNTIFPQYRSISGSYDQLHYNLRGPPNNLI